MNNEGFRNLKSIVLDRLAVFEIPDLFVPDESSVKRALAPRLKKVASGVYGSFHILNDDPKLGVKIVFPDGSYCDGRSYTDLKRGIIYTVPYPGGILMRSVPLPVSEICVAAIMTDLVKQRYTLGYTQMLGAMIMQSDLSMYVLVERLQTNLHDIVNNDQRLLCFLFQVIFTLMVGQEKARFTHYDLHIQNILYTLVSTRIKYMVFPLFNKKVYMVNPGFHIKISDYGMSRAQYKDVIITTTSGDCVIYHNGLFNPYYDLVRLMLYLIADDSFYFSKSPLKSKILSIIFGTSNVDKIIKKWGDPDGYPKGTETGIYQIPIPSMSWILEQLAMLDPVMLFDRPLGGHLADDQILSFTPLESYYVSTGLYDPSITTWPVRSDSVEIFPGITVGSNMQKILGNKRDFTHVITKSMSESCKTGTGDKHFMMNQHIVEVWITPQIALRNGFKFDFPCCKVDPVEYLYLNDLEGVVINGTLHDRLRSFLPIVPFKNERMTQSNNYVYKPYQNLYGAVMIDDSGSLLVGKLPDDRSDLTGYLLTGPMLVYRGQRIIDEQLVRRDITINGKSVKAFQCANDLPNGPIALRKPQITVNESCKMTTGGNVDVQNCNNMMLGSLGDITNQRSRTAIVLLKDRRIGFIVVDLSTSHGSGADGMSLVLMSLWLQQRFGDNIEAAIAVSSGPDMESRIAIRKPDDSAVYTLNKKNSEVRNPEGNLISLVRSRGVRMDFN